MAHPNMIAAMDIYKTGKALGINFLKNQRAQKRFQKQSALSGYIVGELHPKLEDKTNAMTPQQAAADAIKKGADLGISAKSSLSLYSVLGALRQRAKQSGGIASIRQIAGTASQQPASQWKMTKEAQSIMEKTQEGKEKKLRLEEAKPAAMKILSPVKRLRDKYTDYDEFSNALEGIGGKYDEILGTAGMEKPELKNKIMETLMAQKGFKENIPPEKAEELVEKVLDPGVAPGKDLDQIVNETLGLAPLVRENAEIPE